MEAPICSYCYRPSVLVTGAKLYNRRSDLVHKHFLRYKPCDAYGACHPGTDKPIGHCREL